MATKYETELKERFLGKTVEHSEYALRTLRDAWLSCGRGPQKSSFLRQLNKQQAERGTVSAILEEDRDRGAASGLEVTWDDGSVSKCLSYMVELVR